MKAQIILIAVLFVGSCATTPALEEKVVGAYENKIETYLSGKKVDTHTVRLVFLEGGVFEFFRDEKKELECKWKTCKDGSIHVEYESGGLEVYTINSDGGITHIAYVDKDGKRRDYAKERPITLKRIK